MQKVIEIEPLMRYRNTEEDVKTELLDLVRDKPKGNLLTALAASGIEMARAAQRRLQGTREPVVGMLREKFKQRTCKNESTNAPHRDRLVCSSVEASVMEVERRNQLIQRIYLNN